MAGMPLCGLNRSRKACVCASRQVAAAARVVRGELVMPCVRVGLCRKILRGTSLATGLLSRQLGVVASLGSCLTGRGCAARRRAGHARNEVGDGLGNGLDDISPELAVLAAVLLLESELFILVHVAATQAPDLVQDVEQDLFGASVAFCAEIALTYVSAGDIGGAIDRERDAVGHLLTPALSVKARVVPCLLASVDVDPSLLVLGVYLGPDVVLCVPDPTNSASHGTAKHAEAVCPLSNTSSAGVQQSPNIAVPGESFVSAAVSG